MIPGIASHTTLEKIDYLRRITEDPDSPPVLRAQSREELDRINAGGPVHPAYERIRAVLAEASSQKPDLEEAARQAVARARAAQSKPAPATSTEESTPARWPVRAFVATWSELADWWTHYDAEVLANELSDEQIASFLATADGTSTFADDLRTARQALSNPRRHLRAL